MQEDDHKCSNCQKILGSSLVNFMGFLIVFIQIGTVYLQKLFGENYGLSWVHSYVSVLHTILRLRASLKK